MNHGSKAAEDFVVNRALALGLSKTEIAVARDIASFTFSHGGRCFAKQETIAARIGWSVRSVRNALKALETKGVIQRRRTWKTGNAGAGRRIDELRIVGFNDLPAAVAGSSKETAGKLRRELPAVEVGTTGNRRHAHKEETNLETKSETSPPLLPAPPSLVASTGGGGMFHRGKDEGNRPTAGAPLPKHLRGAESVIAELEADPMTALVVAIVLRPLMGSLRPPFEGEPATYAKDVAEALRGHAPDALAVVARLIRVGGGRGADGKPFDARKRDMPAVADVIALAAPHATARASRELMLGQMRLSGLPEPTEAERRDQARFAAVVKRIRGGAQIWVDYQLDIARILRRPGQTPLLIVPTPAVRNMLKNHVRNYIDPAAVEFGGPEFEIVPAAEYARKHQTFIGA